MIKITKSRKILVVAIIIGAIGTVLFVPIKMQSGGTCLVDQLLGGKSSDNPPGIATADLMLRRYLVPFGVAWWLSLGLLVLGWYQFRTLKDKSKEHL